MSLGVQLLRLLKGLADLVQVTTLPSVASLAVALVHGWQQCCSSNSHACSTGESATVVGAVIHAAGRVAAFVAFKVMQAGGNIKSFTCSQIGCNHA